MSKKRIDILEPRALRPGQISPMLPKNTLDFGVLSTVKDYIAEHVNPLDNIIALAMGQPIPGVPNPEPQDVIAANQLLLKKLVPDLKAIEVSGPDRGAINVQHAIVEVVDLIEQVASGSDDDDEGALDLAEKEREE